MADPQKLTMKGMLASMRQAYVENKIGAQHNLGACRYEYEDDEAPGCMCIIGAGLSPELRSRAQGFFRDVYNGFDFHFRLSNSEIDDLDELQIYHDAACRGGEDNRVELGEFRDAFNRLLINYGFEAVS